MTEEGVLKLINGCRNSCGDQPKRDAIAGLCIYLYGNLDRFRLENLDEDTRGDFIAWIYPRFAGIIDQFDPSRASLRTYLTWVVRLSWRTFLKKRYSNLARQKVFEIEEMTQILSRETEFADAGEDGGYTAEIAPGYADGGDSGLSPKRREILSRTVFLLACKAGNYIDDASIRQVSRVTGYSERYILDKIEVIRMKCSKKRDAELRLAERKNEYYIRAQRCLYEMKFLDRESARYFQLKKEYEYCIRRIDTIRTRESRRIRTPSNRLLAATLGISRGTIDATLASARKDRYPEPS